MANDNTVTRARRPTAAVQALLSLVFLTLLHLVVPTRSAWASCGNDTECKGNRICNKGQCEDPPVAACTKDTDCEGDLVCTTGVCTPPTQAPTVGTCVKDDDCPGALVCNDQRCANDDTPVADNSAIDTSNNTPDESAKPSSEERQLTMVSFEGKGYSAKLSAAAGSNPETPEPKTCAAPCLLAVAPGSYILEVDGETMPLLVGRSAVHVTKVKRRLITFAVLGGVLVGAGLAIVGVGYALPQRDCTYSASGSYCKDSFLADFFPVMGGVLAAVGAVQIPLVAISFTHIEVDGKPITAKSDAPVAMSASLRGREGGLVGGLELSW
ncbi:MAG: hypothetical protein U0271_39300 [Polyangiaceae bacterium]